eukprot:g962.t1
MRVDATGLDPEQAPPVLYKPDVLGSESSDDWQTWLRAVRLERYLWERLQANGAHESAWYFLTGNPKHMYSQAVKAGNAWDEKTLGGAANRSVAVACCHALLLEKKKALLDQGIVPSDVVGRALQALPSGCRYNDFVAGLELDAEAKMFFEEERAGHRGLREHAPTGVDVAASVPSIGTACGMDLSFGGSSLFATPGQVAREKASTSGDRLRPAPAAVTLLLRRISSWRLAGQPNEPALSTLSAELRPIFEKFVSAWGADTRELQLIAHFPEKRLHDERDEESDDRGGRAGGTYSSSRHKTSPVVAPEKMRSLFGGTAYVSEAFGRAFVGSGPGSALFSEKKIYYEGAITTSQEAFRLRLQPVRDHIAQTISTQLPAVKRLYLSQQSVEKAAEEFAPSASSKYLGKQWWAKCFFYMRQLRLAPPGLLAGVWASAVKDDGAEGSYRVGTDTEGKLRFFRIAPHPAEAKRRLAILRDTLAALQDAVKISDCKDVDGNASQTKGKYSKLRILYAFDRPMATKHVPTHCRSYGHTKVVVIGLWVVDKQNDPDSPSRRKFFSRFPIDDFMLAYTPFDRPFYQKVMQVVETQRLGLNKLGDALLSAAEDHGLIERVLVGHSNAGPGALALFTRYPELFKTAVLVDPAFCDAATRVTLQTSQVGSAFAAPKLDSSQAAEDDQKSTAELFKQIREMGREWGVYQRYYRYLDDRAKTTGTDVLRDGDDVLKLAKAGNLLPQSLQAEFERTQKGLRDVFAKNKKVNVAWFLEDDTGLSGPWNAKAKAEAKKWKPLRVRDATKNRIYRTDMLEKLRVAQEGLVNGGRKRKLLIAVGDGVPRPWGADRAGHIAYQRSDWETDNPFDMIPWQVYLWQHALQEMNMPNLEVKPPLVVPGGHIEAVSPTIERVLKVEHEKTLLDD